MEPEWIANLREWADENGIDALDLAPDGQWLRLKAHVHAQRTEAAAQILNSPDGRWLRAENGDMFVLQARWTQRLEDFAQLLREALLKEAGKSVLVVVSEARLEKIPAAEAREILERAAGA